MMSYDSIRSFAERVTSELDKVDIAIMNAGVAFATYATSIYGWERTLQVNTISTTLLALLLLPKLRASSSTDHKSTLEFISSGLHSLVKWTDEEKAAKQPLDLFNQKQTFSPNKQYASSKLFFMCALSHIAKLAEAPGTNEPEVYVTSVCPGLTQSNLARDALRWWLMPLFWIAGFLFMRTAEQGARTYVSGATLEHRGHGQFWQHDKIKPYVRGYYIAATCIDISQYCPIVEWRGGTTAVGKGVV